MRLLKTLLLSISTAIVFTGCTTISNQHLADGQIATATLTNCTASGKIAIKDDKQRLSSMFYAELKDPAYELTMTGLTGSTLFRLTSTPNGATILDDKGQSYHGTDADALVKRLTGLNIPASLLPDIMRGFPNKSKDTTNGLTESVTYGEYEITYDAYTKEGIYTLPQKITITGSNNLKIRININKWVL